MESERVTTEDSALALQKLTRYFSEKVSVTDSVSSILVDSSGLSTLFC